jgi:hypothetical protein
MSRRHSFLRHDLHRVCLIAALLGACGGDEAAPATGGAGDGDGDGDPEPGSGGQGACGLEAIGCEAYGSDRPFRTSEHSASYLDESHQMFVFGGTHAIPVTCDFPPAGYVAEAWLFDEGCGAWRQIEQEGSWPSPRGRQAAAAGDGSVYIFGGRFRTEGSTQGDYELLRDIWRFDIESETWEEIEPSTSLAPAARSSAQFVWDTRREQLWLFGGNISPVPFGYQPRNDLWSFDVEERRWTRHDVEGTRPEPRTLHSMVYDEDRDRLVLYGGLDNGFSVPGLWAFDIESETYEQLDGALSTIPDQRYGPRLVFDPERSGYLMFGGHDDTPLGNRNDTWFFDPDESEWLSDSAEDTLFSEANGFCDFPADFANVVRELPERRNLHTLVWSTGCGRVLMFGGKTDCGATDDLWAYGQGGWERLIEASEGEVCHRWRTDESDCSNLCN